MERTDRSGLIGDPVEFLGALQGCIRENLDEGMQPDVFGGDRIERTLHDGLARPLATCRKGSDLRH
jgi:hypothetical protein